MVGYTMGCISVTCMVFVLSDPSGNIHYSVLPVDITQLEMLSCIVSHREHGWVLEHVYDFTEMVR